ncbi:putative fusarinine C esterase Sidjp [[Candida] jaroonii]|uniref:Fusarinine C esterase Sidjp n=1 Tax=[Candida] jaroonii TaxID=467808 RepID=A0ACA9YB11_9ASCO|nr:putative fusarinine C esterase Sidjp [[Candida] jaroonii]
MGIRGTVHEYGFKKTAFEFNEDGKVAENVVVFIGGLTDGLMTVQYLPKLAEKLGSLGNWVLIQGLLTSSYVGWGQSSLQQDNIEIGRLVSYLRSEKGGSRKKIILMGHSTGCQDTIRYLCNYSYQEKFQKSMEIDGGILQAPVSDREGIAEDVGEDNLDKLVEQVKVEYLDKGLKNQMLPLNFTRVSLGYPTTAYRFHSLFSKFGDDDFFSTYITDEQLKDSFGKVKKPLLSLYGDEDQYTPVFVDKQNLISRWQKATDEKYWSKLSKVLLKANHTVDDPQATEDLIETVKKFVLSI